MANDTIGKVPCAFCAQPAPVRKNSKGKLYYVCSGCGIVQPNMPGFQEWILEKATITGAAAPAVDPLTAEERAVIKPDAVVVVHAQPEQPHHNHTRPIMPTTTDKPKRGGFGVIKF